MNSLELIKLAKKFNVTDNEEEYMVEFNEFVSLGATIDKKTKEIAYYVTGAYDSGIDWLNIDMDKLKELKKFCELMAEEK